MKPTRKSNRIVRGRAADDRRQFLVEISSDVIKAIKQAGIEDDRPAWEIMEEAAKDWLQNRKSKRAGDGKSVREVHGVPRE